MYINPNNHLHSPSDSSIRRIINLLLQQGQEVVIDAGEAIIKQGQPCDFFFIVLSGCFRAYRYLNDKEIIIGFTFAGDVDTVPYAYISHTHSPEVIEAVVDSVAVKIYRATLQKLSDENPGLKDFVENLLASYIEVLVNRNLEMKAYTAEEVYHNLCARQPEQVRLIPLKYIASYLGISQERLSRIRNKSLQLT